MIGRWLPVIMLLALALASAWLLDVLGIVSGSRTVEVRHIPDFYMKNFTAVTMDESGEPTRRLEATYMSHFPDTGTKEFADPYLVMYRGTENPWHIRAERGWVSATGEVMLMLGKVKIWRDAEDGSRRLTVETEDLRVLPSRDYGETDKPVVISTPTTKTTGVGMRAYLEKSRLDLLSQARTRYEKQ